jgi:ferredoxin-NADP reductase
VSLKGALLADFRQERARIKYMKTLRDVEVQFVHSAAEQKEMAQASKARTAALKPMEKEKKDILSELESFKKVLVARTKALNQLKQKRHRGNSPIKNGLEKLLATLGIDRAAYHGGNLNGKNVQQMFQESKTIFSQFQELFFGVNEEEEQCNNKEIINIIC